MPSPERNGISSPIFHRNSFREPTPQFRARAILSFTQQRVERVVEIPWSGAPDIRPQTAGILRHANNSLFPSIRSMKLGRQEPIPGFGGRVVLVSLLGIRSLELLQINTTFWCREIDQERTCPD